MRMAVCKVEDDSVINIVVAELFDPPPDGCYFVDAGNEPILVGWYYKNGSFVDLNPPVSDGEGVIDGD